MQENSDPIKQNWKKNAEWAVAMLLILIMVGVLAGIGVLLVLALARTIGAV